MGPIMWSVVHEDDVIDAHLKCFDISEERLGSKKEVFNIAADDSRIDELTQSLLNRFFENRKRPLLTKELDGYTSIVSNAKARRVLGIDFKRCGTKSTRSRGRRFRSKRRRRRKT